MVSKNIILVGILIPFLGTAIGAGTVFFIKSEIGIRLQKGLLGFASGVMIAASVWSLLIPSIETSAQQGKISWQPSAVGFLIGVFFLLLLDTVIPHLHPHSGLTEGKRSKFGRSTMLIIAVVLHNLPEGMAVGVVLAGASAGNIGITVGGALTLAIGIALQNVPEGAIISLPIVKEGISKPKAFLYGVLSGMAEPIEIGRAHV